MWGFFFFSFLSFGVHIKQAEAGLALQPIFLLSKSWETKGEINRKSVLINSALHGIAWFLIIFVWGEEIELIWWGPPPSSISKKIILGQKLSIEASGCRCKYFREFWVCENRMLWTFLFCILHWNSYNNNNKNNNSAQLKGFEAEQNSDCSLQNAQLIVFK